MTEAIFLEKETPRKINNCLTFFLEEIRDSEDHCISIVIKEGKSKEPDKKLLTEVDWSDVKSDGDRILAELNNLASIVPDDTCLSFSIVFDEYATYSVAREIFSLPRKEDVYQGKHLRVYSKSRFIETSQEFLHDFFGNLNSQKHYEIICEWHVISVMSPSEPKIYQKKGRRSSLERE